MLNRHTGHVLIFLPALLLIVIRLVISSILVDLPTAMEYILTNPKVIHFDYDESFTGAIKTSWLEHIDVTKLGANYIDAEQIEDLVKGMKDEYDSET